MLQRLLSQTPYSGELSPLTLSELLGRQKTDMLLSSTLQSVYLVLHVVSLFVDWLSLTNPNNNLVFETGRYVFTCIVYIVQYSVHLHSLSIVSPAVPEWWFLPMPKSRPGATRVTQGSLSACILSLVGDIFARWSETIGDQSTVPCLQSWHLTTSTRPSLTNKKLSQRFCDQQKTTPAHSSMTQKPTLWPKKTPLLESWRDTGLQH